MTLYGDIFFLYNVVTDYAVLKSASIMWRGRGRPFLWCILINFIYMAAVYFVGINFITPYLLLAAAVVFGLAPKDTKRFWGMLATVLILGFLLGSLSLGIMAVFDTGGTAALFPACILLFVTYRADKSIYLNKLSGIYPITLTANGHTVALTAFVDSGNKLKINGRTVVAADRDALSPILPYIDEFFTAPCKTVSGESELTCFYADMTANGKTANTIVAVSQSPINDGFNALINSEFL